MRHISEGALRRLTDEPLAVPDRALRHLQSCQRCQSRQGPVASDAAFAQQAFAVPSSQPQPTYQPNAARAWERFNLGGGVARPLSGRPPRRWRLMGTSIGTGATVAGVGVAIAGVAAAATLTTVFSPTQVAPVPVSQADLEQLASLVGSGGPSGLLSFAGHPGTKTLPFGTLTWAKSGRAHSVPSLSAAESETGLTLQLPTNLPAGVGQPQGYYVVPTVKGTFTFNSSAGADLSGSTLAVTLGPGAGVTYGSVANGPQGPGLDTLGVVALAKPVATATGATTVQLENFLLSQPGIPPDLAQELKLLGNSQTTLPVPVPSGSDWRTATVDGAQAVVVSDRSGTVSGTIWEDSAGTVHLVAGLLDQTDLLSVAQQVG